MKILDLSDPVTKTSSLAPKTAVINLFALKSSIHLFFCSRVSLLDKLSANRMSAKLKVKKGIFKIRPFLF